MNKETERILCESDFMILNTGDQAGFPHSKIISRPLLRQSYHSMKFYLNADSKTIKNAHKNRKGSLYVFQSATRESLLLKGLLTVEPISAYDSISRQLDNFQKLFNYSNPVILCFEIMTVDYIKSNPMLEYNHFL
ncbi:pyridoxamine 5'-phosphate oxidase family protein [Candidatus Enterococcus clewellii]|uniref:Pyridoxamine 5'-phosphate oxidase putative domain-containing protein n=1 Tax=Candidatus Enterococcus clewellii TaxID=1834193 RepID=A0AAQ3VVP4_9ENTE